MIRTPEVVENLITRYREMCVNLSQFETDIEDVARAMNCSPDAQAEIVERLVRLRSTLIV